MLEWTDKYASGSSLVDEQHKELFRRVNLLLASCDEGKGKLEVQRTLEFIREYVQFHFSTEEQLMRKYNFPGYPDHKLEHDKLVKQFLEVAEHLISGTLTLPEILQVHAFLIDWVCAHTLGTDKKMGAFLKSCDVDNDKNLKLE